MKSLITFFVSTNEIYNYLKRKMDLCLKKLLQMILVICLLAQLANAQVPAIEWEKSYGSLYNEVATSVQRTADGGYIVAGIKHNPNLTHDFLVTKLSPDGTADWQQTYGGSGNDYANSVQPTSDGGYVVAGYSDSNDGDVAGNHGFDDVAGQSYSNDGDVATNYGLSDAWIIKLQGINNYSITGPDTICDGFTYTFLSSPSDSIPSVWSVSSNLEIVNAFQDFVDVKVLNASPPTGTITLTKGSFITTFNVAIVGAPVTPEIAGPDSVCVNSSSQFSIAIPTDNTGYGWQIVGGASISAILDNGKSIHVDNIIGDFTVMVKAFNACDSSDFAIKDVKAIPSPVAPAIIGPDNACAGNTTQFSIAMPISNEHYAWQLIGDATIGAIDGNGVSIYINNITGDFTLMVKSINACDSSEVTIKDVKMIPLPAAPRSIVGPETACIEGSVTYFVNEVPGATSYEWEVEGDASITGYVDEGKGITVGNISGPFVVKVKVKNACGSSEFTVKEVKVVSLPSTPGAISGSSNMCGNGGSAIYSIAPVSNADYYVWSLIGNASAANPSDSDTDFIVTNITGDFLVGVRAINVCGSSSPSVKHVSPVLQTPDTPGTITGPTGMCPAGIGYNYYINPVSGATSYTWEVIGPVTNLSGTDVIGTVDDVFSSFTIKVKANNVCGSSGYSSKFVNVLSPNAPGCGGKNDDPGDLPQMVYPNPGKNIMTIQGNFTNTPLMIYDLTGNPVYNTFLNGENPQIDVSSLRNNNSYIIKVADKTIRYVKE